MIEKNGSDLFITEGVPPSLKVHGQILPMTKTPLNAEQAMALVTGIMTDKQKQEFKDTNECQFAIADKKKPPVFVCLPLFSVIKQVWFCVKLKQTFRPPKI